MAVLVALIEVPWFVGLVVALFVLPRRVGFNTWLPQLWMSAFAHEPSRRNGIPWTIVATVKAIAWPIPFFMWLNEGKPESGVLFGPAAAERLGIPFRGGIAQNGFAIKWSRA